VKTFAAPWSRLLIAVSALTTLLCIGITVFGAFHRTPFDWLPLLLIILCAPFTIRGYAITPDAILVKRLFWNTRLPRTDLESATYQPGAMKGSIRTCGNGGMYSFTGFYRNRKLGTYRAFATDTTRAVILRYPNRTIVVSPGDPEVFVRDLSGT
jgi:hypothetical protein